MNKVVIYSVIITVVLNLVLPMIFAPLATDEEKKPNDGVESLDFKGQFMTMMVHHKQVPVSSSCIIAVVVGVSVYLAQTLSKLK
jgi:hypothetical protein